MKLERDLSQFSSAKMNEETEDMNGVTNGIDNVHINDGAQYSGHTNGQPSSSSQEDEPDLPRILIVTNIDDNVFTIEQNQLDFESVFRDIDESVTFRYLKNFKRCRLEFCNHISAMKARMQVHEEELCGKPLRCFFPQVLKRKDSQQTLQPPAPEKQFLISPPASPPVGWEPVHEGVPVVNYDIITALTGLAPGETHEIHPQSEYHPGIVVHVCEDPQGFESRPQKIVQTKMPDRRT